MSFSGRASRRPDSPRRPAVGVGQASRGVGKRGGEVGRFAGCNQVHEKKAILRHGKIAPVVPLRSRIATSFAAQSRPEAFFFVEEGRGRIVPYSHPSPLAGG